jgi:hypothetical protein
MIRPHQSLSHTLWCQYLLNLINEIYKKYSIFKNLTTTLLRNTQILFVFLRQIYKTIC